MDIKSPVGEARNTYTYTADGIKRKTLQQWNSNYSTTPVIGTGINVSSLNLSKMTDYAGNIIYENGSLKRILIEGGYIEGGVYYFYLTDHLGNNRVVANSSGAVIQKTHYYPFGMAFAESTDQGKQPYKYNGKEFDQMHGLNLYDYSARYMEPTLGRFTTVDPLAEKYYSVSPYVYCMDNPLIYTDPSGDSVRVYTETQATGHTWISVGEGDKMVVYSYGRYNGTNKGPDGSFNSLANGPGVLLKLTSEEAKAYNEEKASTTEISVYVVTDVADKTISTILNKKFNSSSVSPDKGKYKDNLSAHVIDEYSLTSNNCTTVVSDVLNLSGSKVLQGTTFQQTSTFGTGTSISITNRFILPSSMQNYFNKISIPKGVVYKSR